MMLKETGIIIGEATKNAAADIEPIGANGYAYWEKNKRQQRHEVVKTFAVSLADIDKALKPKTYTEPQSKLRKHCHDCLSGFDHKAAGTLFPCRGPGIDHHIEVEKHPQTGTEKKVPWGPLYSMS